MRTMIEENNEDTKEETGIRVIYVLTILTLYFFFPVLISVALISLIFAVQLPIFISYIYLVTGFIVGIITGIVIAVMRQET